MKKFSKKIIYHSMLTGLFIGLFIGAYCFTLFQPEEEGFIINSTVISISLICGALAYIIFIVYKILFYNLSGYELKETQIICKRGVVFKKKSVLDYSKINSVNKKQGIIQKLFGLSCLMVDSGATTRAHQAEIMILEDAAIVDKLYNALKTIDKKNPILQQEKEDATIDSNDNQIIEENLYKFKSKSKFIYSLLNSIYVLIFSIFVTGAIFALLYIIYAFAEDDGEALTLFDVIIITVSTYATFILGGFLSSLVRAFIGYYNFRITKVDYNINVEYGLLVNNQNSFNLSKVKGIIVTQGIIQRIFKLASIKIEVIGYVEVSNNNKGVIGTLIPLCKLSEVPTYLEKIIPTHVPIKQEKKAKSFLPFISWNSIIATFITVLCVIPAILISLAYDSTLALIISVSIICGIFVFYELLLLIGTLFAYHIQDIRFDDHNITIYNGSFIKFATVIKKSDIIAIEDITTSFRAKKGIYSYIIHFHTNAMSNTKIVNIVDESYKNLLIDCLKF